jgi:hypothetical protein
MQIMKSILRILADIALLPVSGCILTGNRDYSGDCTRVKLNHQNGGIGRIRPKLKQRTP